jgi:ComF family protein
MWRRWANAVIRFLLDPRCVACDALLSEPLGGPVCGTCWQSVTRTTPPWCARCGDSLPSANAARDDLCDRCRRAPLHVACCRSAGRYEGALRHAIHAFKYDGRRALAAPLARLMRDAGADVLGGADVVVPVPLARQRAWSRGFNQADDLAVCLRRPVCRALRRRRHGPPQAGLTASERRANVQDAYAVRRWHRRRLTGATVVLVDDVMTTGATIDACAAALLEAGAREVRALTAARAASRAAPPATCPSPAATRC